MVQRILVLRKDWRDRTTAILHWMPFIRMDAPSGSQFVLDTAAHYPDVVIGIGQRLLQATSRERMESLMKDMVPDKEGCELAVNLVQHPTFVRNFFELGTEEIRDLPQLPDVSMYTNEKRHERGILSSVQIQRFDYHRRIFCIAATINGFQNSTPMSYFKLA